jgi:hypothetical protein
MIPRGLKSKYSNLNNVIVMCDKDFRFLLTNLALKDKLVCKASAKLFITAPVKFGSIFSIQLVNTNKKQTNKYHPLIFFFFFCHSYLSKFHQCLQGLLFDIYQLFLYLILEKLCYISYISQFKIQDSRRLTIQFFRVKFQMT